MRKQLNQIVAEAAANPATDIYDVAGTQVATVKRSIRRAALTPVAYLLTLATVIALQAIYVWPTIVARITH